MLSLAIATALSFAAPPCDIALVSELLAPDSDWRTAQEDAINMAVHLGARIPKRIAAKLAPCGGTAAKFAKAVDQDEVAATILRAAIQLESTQVEAKTRASYLAWADCIKPLPVADILMKLGDPRYAAEYIMTFGLRPASNIAQRFADAIVSIWRRRTLAAETNHTKALMETDLGFAAWVQSQGGPSAATAALFAVFIYTDDHIFIIVGALRMVRGLHIWTTLCKQVGLLMAIETKRQCGTHVEWLGAGISSLLAMAWVPKHKIAAALAKIEVMLAGNSTMQM